MCLDHGPPTEPAKLTRRAFTTMLLGAGGLLLTGCPDDGIGFSLLSPEQVERFGLEAWEKIRADTRPSDEAAYQQRVERVAADILRAAGESPAAWEVVVFEGAEANAFALPGGKIGIFEGMFQYAQTDDQLAAIIGHEIGHNQAAHAAERMNAQLATDIGLRLIGVALGLSDVAYADQIAAILGAGVQYGVILPYSRSQELEADRIGLRNMAQAGYDPEASIALWETMATAGPRVPGFLSTHPAPEARIEALQALMPEAMEVYRDGA